MCDPMPHEDPIQGTLLECSSVMSALDMVDHEDRKWENHALVHLRAAMDEARKAQQQCSYVKRWLLALAVRPDTPSNLKHDLHNLCHQLPGNY